MRPRSIANMETDLMCWVQDDCQTETYTRYCVRFLILVCKTDTCLQNRYSFAKQVHVCFGACALFSYKRELIRPQITAPGFKSMTMTSVAVQPTIYTLSNIQWYHFVVFMTKLPNGSKKIDNIIVNFEKQSNGPDYRVSFNQSSIIIYLNKLNHHLLL